MAGGNANLIIFDEDGYDEDGYDKDGYDKNGYKDGKNFDQSKGEHFPLLPITSTSEGRETRRPFKPRKRTSTRKDVSFSNPSYGIDDDEMETPFGDELLHSSKDPRVEFNNELRADVKRLFPRMTNSVQVGQKDGRLLVRLFGNEKKWSSVYNKNGKISLQFNKDLKKALGFNREDIIKANDEQNSIDKARIYELEKDLERKDISEEVRNTTINEINELKEGVNERNKEN